MVWEWCSPYVQPDNPKILRFARQKIRYLADSLRAVRCSTYRTPCALRGGSFQSSPFRPDSARPRRSVRPARADRTHRSRTVREKPILQDEPELKNTPRPAEGDPQSRRTPFMAGRATAWNAPPRRAARPRLHRQTSGVPRRKLQARKSPYVTTEFPTTRHSKGSAPTNSRIYNPQQQMGPAKQ
jgi:hypothetical protein